VKVGSAMVVVVLARAVRLAAIAAVLVSVLLVAGALLAGCSSSRPNTTALTLATTTTITAAQTTSETPSSGHHPDTTAATFAPMPDTTAAPIPTTTLAYLPLTMPANFAFTAAYGVGANNLIDTFDGTFTKDVIAAPKPNPTTSLRLTSKEMAALYDDLVDIGILDYPSDFHPDAEQEAKTGVHQWMDPHPTYVLRVRAAGCDKYIFWEDGSGSVAPKATALRHWFDRLKQMIEAKPEYKAMPPTERAYL
jgi:hypothetical protein